MRKHRSNNTKPSRRRGGPVTLAGIERSKMNAITSGLYSKQPLIKTKFYAEDEETLRRREEELRMQFCPESGVEEMCLQQILYHYQCIERTKLYENACVESGLRKLEDECTGEITTIQGAVVEKENKLAYYKKRLDELNRNEDGAADSISGPELDYLLEQIEGRLSDVGQAALVRAKLLGKQVYFMRELLKWDAEAIRTMLIAHVEQTMAAIESQLSELRSALQVKSDSLTDRIKSGQVQLLIVDAPTLERIERSRSSHSKHMHRAMETMMKLQAFRIQKMRLTGGSIQIESHSE